MEAEKRSFLFPHVSLRSWEKVFRADSLQLCRVWSKTAPNKRIESRLSVELLSLELDSRWRPEASREGGDVLPTQHRRCAALRD